MNHSLTIVYVTARRNPEIRWFFDSLVEQLKKGDEISIVTIDFSCLKTSVGGEQIKFRSGEEFWINSDFYAPKPTVWQGDYRLTKDNWWATSNYRNTGICLCKTEWIAFLDDRCVLMPHWLKSIREAMDGNYAVCGSYEKRHGMTVENGIIKHGGIVTGTDPRKGNPNVAVKCSGSWFFGCTTAMPLEWALNVNGYDESCDSLGLEDCIFGEMLERNGYPIKFDERMKIIEDRTPSDCEPPLCKRTDLGVSPDDKSHALLRRVAGKKQATHHLDLREIREKVLRGEPFPEATEPKIDWYNGKPLSEFP